MVDVVGGGSRLFILSALNLHVFVADQGVHGDEVACRHQGLDGRTKQDEVTQTSTTGLIKTENSPAHGTEQDMTTWSFFLPSGGGLGLG